MGSLNNNNKKRKSLATSLDEVDRSMYSTFCTAANSLSQLYSQSIAHQKLSFISGERHALDKLYQWISKQQGEGLRVTTDDIKAYIQAELESYVEEPITGPRAVQQSQQHMQAANPFTNSGPSSVPVGPQGFRCEQIDQQQPRNYIFSNALSSPVRRSLQNYHISQEGGYGVKNNEPHQNRDSYDSSMDMHADHGSSTH